jgi:hypothetical protein
VIAPGKLVLTGAYAVLEGAPAIVIAVDRHAVADVTSPGDADVSALHDASGRKLGLGSSAASMVASEGARAVARGEDPRDPLVRASIFRAVRGAHAVSQGGGSGVDVAASVHGGVLRYELTGGESRVHPLQLPRGLVFEAWWSGWSARTSDLLARLRARALRARSGRRRAHRPAGIRRARGDGRARGRHVPPFRRRGRRRGHLARRRSLFARVRRARRRAFDVSPRARPRSRWRSHAVHFILRIPNGTHFQASRLLQGHRR